jgi:hypothetical protein
VSAPDRPGQAIPNYLDTCEPEARIEQTGRWTYSITITHGLMSIGPGGYGWLRFGRDRAERKAMRELARYKRDLARRKAAWTISWR